MLLWTPPALPFDIFLNSGQANVKDKDRMRKIPKAEAKGKARGKARGREHKTFKNK